MERLNVFVLAKFEPMGCSAAAQVQVSSKNSLVLSFTFYLVFKKKNSRFRDKKSDWLFVGYNTSKQYQRRESRDEILLPINKTTARWNRKNLKCLGFIILPLALSVSNNFVLTLSGLGIPMKSSKGNGCFSF